MRSIEGRPRKQPAPAHALFEALSEPQRPGGRSWLLLNQGESVPEILRAVADEIVEWSSLWPDLPDARITFTISPGTIGASLAFRITVPDRTDIEELESMRFRLSELVNRDLRLSFGQ